MEINWGNRYREIFSIPLSVEKPEPGPKPEPVDKHTYFYIESAGESSNNLLQVSGTFNSSDPDLQNYTFETSLDQINWTSHIIDASGSSALVEYRDRIYIRSNAQIFQISGKLGPTYKVGLSSNGDFNIGGNIMSLLYGSSFTGNEVVFPESARDYVFSGLFSYSLHLRDISNLILPATTLINGCYYQMFQGCSLITETPQLPATEISDYCYAYMFRGCTALEHVPETLPATTLYHGCYFVMFQGCTSLEEAPMLPATTMAPQCYQQMFQDCTSLTEAPQLPATTLAEHCYGSMFSGCTFLTSAPSICSVANVTGCYGGMFYGCSSLSSISITAASGTWDTNNSSNWLSGVAASGFMTANARVGYNIPTSNASGCPSGWELIISK